MYDTHTHTHTHTHMYMSPLGKHTHTHTHAHTHTHTHMYLRPLGKDRKVMFVVVLAETVTELAPNEHFVQEFAVHARIKFIQRVCGI